MSKIQRMVAGLLAIVSLSAFGQDKDQKWGIGLNAGLRDYKGDLGDGFFKLSQNDISAGIWGGRYLNSSLDANLNLNFGGINYKHSGNDMLTINGTSTNLDQRNFRGTLLDYSLGLKYKINNGYLLPEGAAIAPYLGVGIGVLHTIGIKTTLKDNSSIDEKNITALNLPLSVGLRMRLEDKVSLIAGLTYNNTFTDELDGIKTSAGGSNDKYLQYNLGFIFNLGKMKDTDADGVPDKLDKCLDTRPGVKVNLEGCDLDTDGDGVADADDACPEQKGTVKGCPDSDGDGVKDTDDKCPTVAGIEQFAGCPDTDGDGFQDAEDKCPTVAGIEKFAGCPDTDGDGLQDAEDKCPTVAGKTELSGCPDADSDGIADADDKCPNTAGIAANAGCPEIKQEVIAKAAKSAKGINFETGSEKILKTSFKDLDILANLMKEEADLKAEIQGHTDNAGKADKNKELSQKRADAVKKYLVDKGIDASRLTAVGYGQEQPIANNNTAAGKAKNRRVEFKLGY